MPLTLVSLLALTAKALLCFTSNGIGRTGAFCVVYTGVQEINHGRGIIQIPELVHQLRQQRKSMIQDKEQLKFCYDSILYYAQDLLMKSKFRSFS